MERERGVTSSRKFLDIAAEHTSLDGCADRYDLVGVDAFVWVFVEEFAHCILYAGMRSYRRP